MKRAFLQTDKPAQDTESELEMDQYQQVLPEVNRRARTSAAMIGLAISMGAYSLLMPRQGDNAVAAEPVTEPTIATTPSAFEATPPSLTADNELATTQAIPTGSGVEHTVQEGQTLWTLAQMYRVDIVAIAANNGIRSNAVLHVGQVLSIPTASGAIAPAPVQESLEEIAAVDQSQVLKAEQDAALARLKHKRDTLKASLVDLQTEAPKVKSTETAELASPPIPEQTLQIAQQVQPERSSVIAYYPPATETSPASRVEAVKPSFRNSLKENRYQIVPGDTIATIARKHGISPQELIAANRLIDPNVIFANQFLNIPRSVAVERVNVSAINDVERPAASLTTVPALPDLVASTQAGAASAISVAPVKSVAPTTTAAPTVPSVLAVGGSAQPESTSQASILTDKTKTTIATAPTGLNSFSEGRISQPSQLKSESRYSVYAERLQSEILQLRQKYQGQAAQPVIVREQAATIASIQSPAQPAASSQAINPEFNPTRYTAALRGEIRSLQERYQPEQIPVAATSTAKPAIAPLKPAPAAAKNPPQLVATAALGSESYDPLIQIAVGQMVSPELPAIGSPDAYLPQGSVTSRGLIWPAKGVLTSGYGQRWGRMHRGIDIAAPVGTPVVAAAAGVVITSEWNSGGYGNLVEIQHADGSVTLYAHNNRNLVREGQKVEQGEQIAEMGSTGYSTGPHSHFEVHLPGQGAVNPVAYLPRSRG